MYISILHHPYKGCRKGGVEVGEWGVPCSECGGGRQVLWDVLGECVARLKRWLSMVSQEDGATYPLGEGLLGIVEKGYLQNGVGKCVNPYHRGWV